MLKKWKKGAWLAAAAIMVAALAFVACKNIEDGDEIQPPAPEQGASGGNENPGGEQNPGGNLGGEEGENPVPSLEYSYEITSVSMPNENISPKRVSEILGELLFDYTMTHPSTDAGYPQSRVSYGNLPEEIKREIKFKERTENGGVERTSEYEFPENQKEIPFEIWHGGKSLFEKTLKNGNYNRAAITRKIIALLKEIIGEADYDAISPNAKSGNLTFTAESVKAVYDHFPALEKDAEAGKEAKDVENTAVILQNKEAFVAQAEGEVEIKLGPIYPDWYEMYPEHFNEETTEKKLTVKYKKNFAFKGVFNLDELQFEKVDGAQGDFNEATLRAEEIRIDKLNTIRGNSLPTLSGNLKIGELGPAEINVHLYDLYSAYSKAKKLEKLNEIKGNMEGYWINGAKDKNDEPINGYTLFTDDDKAKLSSDPSVKSLPVDALVHMYKNLGIKKFINMIISGEPTESAIVDWSLTNIVFEGDMSKIKNEGTEDLVGIIYFKKAVYNNIDRNDEWSGQSVYGLLKLDSLNGVSYDTFGIALSADSAVLDVRGVNKEDIDNYNSDGSYGILAGGGYAHAIYFSKDFNDIKNNQDDINKFCYKFSKHPTSGAGFINAYFGSDRVNGESYKEIPQSIIGARNSRSLREFEYFGNSFENNGIGEYKFEKTAKETYKDDWENLSTFDQNNLKVYLNTIALTNRSHFCIKAKSVV